MSGLSSDEIQMLHQARLVLTANEDLGPDYELDQVMVALARHVETLAGEISRLRVLHDS